VFSWRRNYSKSIHGKIKILVIGKYNTKECMAVKVLRKAAAWHMNNYT
jgi:hypothetical protein